MFDLEDYGPVHLNSAVVTLGNFDGFHRGHQALIETTVRSARSESVPSVVYTFHPHPTRVLRPDIEVRMLEPFERRIQRILGAGVDHVVVLPFTPDLSRLEPELFLSDLILSRVHPRVFVAGPDTRFGHARAGDVSLLRQQGSLHGFDVIHLEPFLIDGERVSSSGLRKLVESGQVAKAATWLGRRLEVSGVVQRGDGRGGGIGFPTANLILDEQHYPALGVYAVYGRLGASNERFGGVANLGIRPTFEFEAVAPRLEVHFFAPPQLDLYGAKLHVEFVEQLRGEQKFGSVDELCRQIQRDVDKSKAVIAALEGRQR